MPHGQCFLWDPEILTTMFIGNVVIFLSYLSIPIILIYFLHSQAHKIKSPGPYIAYALFILSCGIGHLISILNIWHGYYHLSAWWAVITGFWSFTAAIVTYKIMKKYSHMAEELDTALLAIADK